MSRIGRLVPSTTAFLLCDVQERFRPVIHNFGTVIHVSKMMSEASKIMSIPLLVTEQNSKALGKTVEEVDVSHAKVFEKTKFSMIIPELKSEIERSAVKSIVLFGIETHVCCLQTCQDLLEMGGIDVHLAIDGLSSQRPLDKAMALERMKDMGCYMSTSESILLQLLGDASSPSFKAISKLLKQERPDKMAM